MTELAAAPREEKAPRIPIWMQVVIATVGVQTTTSFLSRLIPTLAPILTAEHGLSPSAVGHFAAVNTIGAMLFLTAGVPLIRRYGPLRTLQIGTLLGAFGVLLFAIPLPGMALLAVLLMGLGYGPSAPAGSDLLQRYAPKERRTLIFSVKQAGVPLGGMVAGLVLPPLAAIDWRVALAAAAAIATVAAFAVQPARATTDTERDRAQSVGLSAFLSPANLTAPLRAALRSKVLPRLSLSGAAFAVGQGCVLAFVVTYFVTGLGMSLPLAGAVFAAMQVAGVIGRVSLGWLSDWWGSGLRTLRILGFTATATLVLFALTSPAWPLWALVALATAAGVTVTSWNGVQLAEVARFAPPGKLSETASGSTLMVFVGYVLGPLGFSLLLDLGGSFRLCFLAVAACIAIGTLPLFGLERRAQ